jgi:hypothetical protein
MDKKKINTEITESNKTWLAPEIITIGMESVEKTTGIAESASPTFSMPS